MAEALRWHARVEWLLSLLHDTPAAVLRSQALAAAGSLGKTGTGMVDFAMEGSP